MNKLESLRKEIDSIDAQMVELFEQRMQIAKKIGIIKHENDISILDKQREQYVIEINLSHINDTSLLTYYTQFIKFLLKLSKDMQEKSCSFGER